MASIEKRTGKKGTTYRAVVAIGTTRRSASFRRKTDAVEWSTKVEHALRDGQHFPDRQERHRTVEDLIARYRTEILPTYSRREQSQRAGKLAWWAARLGSRRLLDLRPSDIAACLDALARGDAPSGRPASPATQTLYLAVIRHALSRAKRKWEWISDNPAQLVEPPTQPRGRVRYLSPAERDRLLATCSQSAELRLHPLVVLAMATGARQGELLNLRWSDIDLTRRHAILQETKNGDRRALALAGPALDVLGEMAQRRLPGADLVFASRRGLATFPREAWERALRDAELEDFRFHDLRHTAASYLAMSGATLAEIAEILGHKTLAMVKRYAHLSHSHVSDVVQRMTEKFLS
jgi:integrase